MMLICEVCDKNEATYTCSVPGVPISCAYCVDCFNANAHPWGIVVANTACLGGLQYAAYWWKDIVYSTCTHLGKTKEEFEKAVAESIKIFEEKTCLCYN